MGCCLPSENTGQMATDLRETRNTSNNNSSSIEPQTQQNSKTAEKASKIIFMGNPNVGKTSIIDAYMEGGSQRGKPKAATRVIQDFTKVINVSDSKGAHHALKLNIWDAAGDATVHNLAHLFLKEAQVRVLCYAIDNKNSFDQLSEWSEHLRDKEGEMFIVVVGSKSDLAANRAVPAVFAQRLRKELPNCKFAMETSAFENVGTINQLFEQIGREIIEGGYFK